MKILSYILSAAVGGTGGSAVGENLYNIIKCIKAIRAGKKQGQKTSGKTKLYLAKNIAASILNVAAQLAFVNLEAKTQLIVAAIGCYIHFFGKYNLAVAVMYLGKIHDKLAELVRNIEITL